MLRIICKLIEAQFAPNTRSTEAITRNAPGTRQLVQHHETQPVRREIRPAEDSASPLGRARPTDRDEQPIAQQSCLDRNARFRPEHRTFDAVRDQLADDESQPLRRSDRQCLRHRARDGGASLSRCVEISRESERHALEIALSCRLARGEQDVELAGRRRAGPPRLRPRLAVTSPGSFCGLGRSNLEPPGRTATRLTCAPDELTHIELDRTAAPSLEPLAVARHRLSHYELDERRPPLCPRPHRRHDG
jgi:hypothetical protein